LPALGVDEQVRSPPAPRAIRYVQWGGPAAKLRKKFDLAELLAEANENFSERARRRLAGVFA
jgi:hypothetical protein